MNRIAAVEPWDRSMAADHPYDLDIVSLGYESRARFIASELEANSKSRLAIGFARQQECAYKDNKQWFLGRGYKIQEVEDGVFFATCAETIHRLTPESSQPIRVRIDISSMSRLRVASLLAAFVESSSAEVFLLDFVYAASVFMSPPREMSQIESAGPVIPQLAGWSFEPDKPVSTVFGLGFEYDRAIGVVEYLEPSEVWSFNTEKHDEQFDQEVMKANKFFWKSVPNSHRLTYRIDAPIDCLIDLESLTFGLLKQSRPILVPLGPKIFSLCCLLVAYLHFPRVGVWRVSSGVHENPIDRKADGSITGMRVRLTREDRSRVT